MDELLLIYLQICMEPPKAPASSDKAGHQRSEPDVGIKQNISRAVAATGRRPRRDSCAHRGAPAGREVIADWPMAKEEMVIRREMISGNEK
ncbi:hypothetical protein EVAR_48553_1 [Eumeta japonica]|uniref:Uncharacterized protein n=1 Tax=Eumeta variegata TaxID=151549 RepID=A0A4C1YBP2_EUMVA|nr:hypothetical protein EVAR_48553_1 [Eumeta japonica]